MRHYERTKRALYWTAVSLIVCEGLRVQQAAERMGIDDDSLLDILQRRRTIHLDQVEQEPRSYRRDLDRVMEQLH